jgi:tetratricopeptide (TPR) repeat protein
VAVRRLRAGLAELGWSEGIAGDGLPAAGKALTARLLMTLAHMESELGHVDDGLRLLVEAERYVTPGEAGILCLQRGLLLLRSGRWQAALAQLTAAEPLLEADAERLAATLLNRGVLYLNTGDIGHARNDLSRAGKLGADAGLELIVAMATHNMGYCELLSGDIPSALHKFADVIGVYQRTAVGNVAVLETDRARALLAAGLAAEASSDLESAIEAFRRQRLDQYCAEAEMSRAQSALVTGDLAAARRWSTAAMRRFRARGNDAWAALAELTRLRANLQDAIDHGDGAGKARRQSPVRLAAEATELASRLRGHRLRADAAHAELLAARALIAAARFPAATRRLSAAGSRGLPFDIALLRRLVRAEFAVRSGAQRAALAELRAGLNALHDRRGQFGSLDLQTGTTALGTQLAGMGLRLTLDQGTPRQVFAWMERSRAQAFRVRPVRPPDDTEAAALLAEFRQLTMLTRMAELNGDRPPDGSAARMAHLQRQIRQRHWQSAGAGTSIGLAAAGDVGDALTASGQVLAALLVHDGHLRAVTIRGHSVRLVPLGDFERATEATRKLTADLDALAGRKLRAAMETVIRHSIGHQTQILDTEIIAPLRAVIADDGLVLIPTGPLGGVPWSMLPSLRGRPVTVSPSASHWLATWRRLAADGPQAPQAPVLVAGPGLRYAEPEVTELAGAYPDASPLTGDKATVHATLTALDGARLAHLAVHGHHDRDNVLFSSLDLADGPLMAYDIEKLRAAPRQVVLSACDVGRAVVRPGDEILGFTAALLHAGTRTVISCVTRVGDDIAPAIMTAYHDALRRGSRPAEALASASAAGELSPFVCFGAG